MHTCSWLRLRSFTLSIVAFINIVNKQVHYVSTETVKTVILVNTVFKMLYKGFFSKSELNVRI